MRSGKDLRVDGIVKEHEGTAVTIRPIGHKYSVLPLRQEIALEHKLAVLEVGNGEVRHMVELRHGCAGAI